MSKPPQIPPALQAPPIPEPTEEQRRLELHKQQMRMSYGMVFHSEHGKRVLADLKARYGWDGEIERPSYRPGMTFDQVAAADSIKEPIRHILAMIQPFPEQPQPKPTTATS